MSAWIVMGVSGCGKSTVAKALAEKSGGLFLDADDFHPPENIAKMAAGIALTDADREPWLDVLNHELRKTAVSGRSIFLACSALRQIYRDRLVAGFPEFQIIYLRGSKERIFERMEARENHFMPPGMLDSQFAALEEPVNAFVVSIEEPVSEIVRLILAQDFSKKPERNIHENLS